ncbi:hypothetical protein E3H11_43675, partial [Bradyrhizobium brasilense]
HGAEVIRRGDPRGADTEGFCKLHEIRIHQVGGDDAAVEALALADGGPYVISVEVPTDSEVSPWAFIHPARNN